jgi:hypothetical protein
MTPVVPRERVVPFGGWVTATAIFLVCFLTTAIIFMGRDTPWWLQFLVMIVGPALLSGYALLVSYVYGDARRRGMRYVMWTLLAIFLTNGIGIILYFILRDPLLVYCSKCGTAVQRNHAFCPRCGAGVQSACPGCRRILQPGWTHCAWCGNRL